MNNIIEPFKQVFISQKNSGYLFDLITNKTIHSKPYLKDIFLKNMNLYRENMIDIQQLIFKDYFNIIYNNYASSGNIDLEDILIELNKITVSKFEFILCNDLSKKYHQYQIEYKQNESKQIINTNLNTHLNTNLNKSTNLNNNNTNLDSLNTNSTRGDKNKNESIQNKNENYRGIENENENYSGNENVLKIYYKEFFSDNAIYENGTYKFPFYLDNIKTINIDKIKIKCNLYNINEYNNKFYLIEQNNKTLITIPIGYYDIEFILQIISECLNGASINKKKDYYYKVYNNTIKNKICFCCELLNPDKIGRPVTFSISFIENKKSIEKDTTENILSLQEMLGFTKNDYSNNNFYIAEDHPNINLFEEIYIKLFINNDELNKYESSKKDFCFFESIDINMNESFGKLLISNLTNNPYYIQNNNLKTKDLSIKLYNSYDSYITSPLWFKLNLSFEYV